MELEEAPPVAEDAPAAEAVSIRSGLEAAFAGTAEEKPAVAAESKPRAGESPPANAGEVKETPAVTAPPTERAIPERLKSRFGEKWTALPPEIRETFHEYESNIGRLAHRYGKDAKSWNDTQAIFAPYQEMVRSEGGDFNGAVSNLLETARILRQGSQEQKVVLLRQTAQMFNVPLESLLGGNDATGAPRSAIDEATINRLNALEREVLTTRGTQTHNAHQQVNQDLDAFTSDPANVYLHEPGYMETMAQLIKVGRAEGLQDAYTQAAWMHERPRQLEIAKQSQQRLEQSRAAADRSKRAATSVNGSAPGAVRRDTAKMGLRDTLSAAFDGELE